MPGQTPIVAPAAPTSQPIQANTAPVGLTAEAILKDAYVSNPAQNQAPVQNTWQQPANPGWQQPVNPGWQQPVNPSWQQPVQPTAPVQQQQPSTETMWQQPTAPASAPAQPLTGAARFGLSDTQYATYEDAIPVIEAVFNSMASSRFNQYEQNTKAAIQQVSAQQEADFINRVRAEFPQFDAVVNHPNWEMYLKSRIPGTSFTHEENLIRSHAARDMSSVLNAMQEFAKGVNLTNQPNNFGSNAMTQPFTSPPSAVQPPSASAPFNPQTNNNGQMFKFSTYNRASAEYRAGRMPKAEFDKVDTIYAEAERRGAVDYGN